MIAHRDGRGFNAEAQRRRGAEVFGGGLSWRLNGFGLRRGVLRSGRSNQRKDAKTQRRKDVATIVSEAPGRPSVLGCCTSIQRRRSDFRAMSEAQEIRKNRQYYCDDPLLRCCALAPLRLCVSPPTENEAAEPIGKQRRRGVRAAMAPLCDGSAPLRLCASALIPPVCA